MHIMHTMAWQRVHKMHGQSVPAPFTARTSEACHRPMTRRRLSACLAGRGRQFFFCKRGLPSPNVSANHMARILSTSYVHVHVHTRTVNVCAMISYVILKYAPYDWLKCNPRLQKKKSRAGAGPGPLHVVSLFTAPFTARTSEACHRPMTRRRLSARPA